MKRLETGLYICAHLNTSRARAPTILTSSRSEHCPPDTMSELYFTPEPNLVALAHHEAGHAVASYALGRGSSIRYISILTDGNVRPGCVHEGEDLISTTQGIEAAITEVFAGRAAQLYLSDELSSMGEAWAEHREAMAIELQAQLPPDPARTDRLRTAAEEIVAAQWGQVEALAAELLEHEVLDRHEVRDVLHIANGVDAAEAYLVAYRKLRDRFFAN